MALEKYQKKKKKACVRTSKSKVPLQQEIIKIQRGDWDPSHREHPLCVEEGWAETSFVFIFIEQTGKAEA